MPTRQPTILITTCLALSLLACQEAALETSYSQSEPVVLVDDVDTMLELERRGISFASAMGLSGSAAEGLVRADQLFASSERYRALAEAIADELQATKDAYDARGLDAYGLSYASRSGWGNASMSAAQRQYAYRLPNPTWVTSPDVFFELTGVSNRFDRRAVPARQSSCGERRLVFRMAYDTRGSAMPSDRQEYSRLPLTLVVAYPQRSGNCRDVAQSWLGPEPGQSMADFLSAELADLGDPFAIELNTQIERWPQDVKPDSVGTFHGYALRVFRVLGNSLSTEKLENTPDLELLLPSPGDSETLLAAKESRRAELLDWVVANAEAIDEGRAIVPTKFLAERVASYTGMGPERMANKLFSQALLFDEGTGGASAYFERFEGQSLAGLQSASPGALLRRLDAMTCSGCHQTRSIVGIHLAGQERHPDERVFNKLALGASTHLLDEVHRRRADLEAYLASGSSSPRSAAGVAMPSPEHGFSPELQGPHGAPCSLGVDPGLDFLRCKAGLICQDPDGRGDADDAVGVCVSNLVQGGARIPQTGDVCEFYDYRAHPDAYEDEAELLGSDSACLCGRKASDFPQGGTCMNACTPGQATPEGTTCAVVSAENFFNECFGRMPFENCMEHALQNDRLLRNCDATTPCRDEFACMAYPGRDASQGQGVCAPAYLFSQFLFGPHVLR